tara:strand:+ start:2153 stop:2638 length:486 start_codon:yes stop_codon:yes gene_type:complete
MSIVFEKIYKDFVEFTFTNKVVVSGAGFAVGFATNELLKNILADIILPTVLSISTMLNIQLHPAISFIVKILWMVLSWIITIILGYIFLEYVLNRWILGLTSKVVKEEDKGDYIELKKNAKESGNILPTSKDIQEIEREKEIIDNMIDDPYSEFVKNYKKI